MIKLSTKPPYIRTTPGPLRAFARAGRVDDIFRPRALKNGIFATSTGYGVSFSLGGVDSEGLDRATLDYLSKQIEIANRSLPEDCILFEYLVTTTADAIPARVILDQTLAAQARERSEFLAANAKFKTVRLFLTLYIPGKVETSAEDFNTASRGSLRALQHAAAIYEQQLRVAGISRLTPDEMVQFYSYLLNFDRSMITHAAAKPGRDTKRLGRVHIGVEGEYLRVGKHYCQVLSLVEPPRGTRPDLWGGLLAIDCEMIWCSVWQRQKSTDTRSAAAAVENATGMAGQDIYSAVIGGYNPNIPPPKRATTLAQDKQVDKLGDVLAGLDDRSYYGKYALFGFIHSRDRAQVEAALPRIQSVFSDPSEAGLMEEHRGAISAYHCLFPGQQSYNVRSLILRGDHRANVQFAYAPFVGHQWSDDLQDEYTMVYETRQGTPFFFTPFQCGNGNTTILGAPGRGKSFNVNALFCAALKHDAKTFIFDQGGSYESNVRALGGSVTHLGLDAPRLNIFAVPDTRENKFAIARLVRLMLEKSGVEVSNDDMDAIENAVRNVFVMPAEMRRLGNLFLPPGLRQGLKRWREGGIYADIFDNLEDDLRFHDLQLFDFASLGDKHGDLLEVEMSWILMLCQNVIRDKRLLGVPKHIVMDELWKRMGVLPVLTFVLETIKADRKNLAWATLITQSLEDLGEHAARIKNACPNTMFLGGTFNRDLYHKHFRLNPRELDELEGLGERELALKVDGEPFVVGGAGYFKVLRMNLDPAAYVRATTKPSERAMRERLVSELGATEGMAKMKELAASYRGAN